LKSSSSSRVLCELERGREWREEKRRVKKRKKRDETVEYVESSSGPPGWPSQSVVLKGERRELPCTGKAVASQKPRQRNESSEVSRGPKVNFVASQRRRRLPQTPLYAFFAVTINAFHSNSNDPSPCSLFNSSATLSFLSSSEKKSVIISLKFSTHCSAFSNDL
jgi:hypothetical protein